MHAKSMIAIDMGASNGRIIWGQATADGLEMQEMHRFPNISLSSEGLMCWDLDQLLADIRAGLQHCLAQKKPVDSIGLCSWGNTVGLLDENDHLLLPPLHYREPATEAALPLLHARLSEQEMFWKTLFSPMSIQPAVVLSWLMQHRPQAMQATRTVLMISDLFNQQLCGRKVSEITMAATSQLVDMRTLRFNREYMRELGLNPEWFPELTESAVPLAPLSDEWVREIGLPSAPMVVAVSGHDTASAASVVDLDSPVLYLSCGTWSCMGCRVEKPVSDIRIFRSGATNDLGVFGQHHLRFNHTGLWILQECKRFWNEQGIPWTHHQLMDMAREAKPFLAVIDTEDKSFFLRDQMPQKVQDYCRRTGQTIPETPAEICRVVMESLALRYRYSAETLAALSGQRFEKMQILSGGAKNTLLCQFSADALGMEVVAGPVEASTLGNFTQQLIAAGMSPAEARALCTKGRPSVSYAPADASAWHAQYQKALKICGWKPIETLGE